MNRGPKINGYQNLHLREQRRRDRAVERIAARNQRTTEEQLGLIATRPGESRRELQRLTRRSA